METFLREFIARQRKTNFADFKGAAVNGTVPLRQELVNELAQQAVRGSDKLKAVQIGFRDNNIIHIKATVKVLFATPTVEIAAQVENMQTSQGVPVLRFQLVPLGGGLLETFLPMILNMVPFPESITVSGRQVDINIHTILTRRGLGEFASLVQRFQVRVRQGIAEIDFGVKVN